MTGLLSNDSKKTFGELFFRGMVAQRVGGATFDEGGSYVFSQMLNAQRELQKTAVEGDPSSTVLAFSVADPTLKIIWENFLAGIDYFKKNIDSARYTDLSGAKDLVIDDVEYENTQDALAGILNNKYPSVGRNNPITSDMVQYTYDSIKGPLSTHVPTTFFDSDSVILMPTPSYGVIAEEINRCDAKVHSFPIDKSGDNFDIFMSSLEEAHADALLGKHDGIDSVTETFSDEDITDDEENKKIFLYLNVPHNPSGFVFTLNKWQEVVAWAKANNIMLIVDEAYTDLDYSGKSASVIEVDGWEDVCIVLQSVSKAHGATGLRFGYILSHPIAIKALRKVIDCKNSGAFAPVIAIGLACLSDFEGGEETRYEYKTSHTQLAEALGKAGFPAQIPDAGLCQLTNYPKSARLKTVPDTIGLVQFEKPSDFAEWLRNILKISVMAQDAISKLRWAVTFREQPKFGLKTKADVLEEVGRRLAQYSFEF
jgi:aspartate/methionine/tyrosine aminotransferase